MKKYERSGGIGEPWTVGKEKWNALIVEAK